jgi:hypothetical protein
MREAITLTEWFLNEAHRIYAMFANGTESIDNEAESLLSKIRQHGGKSTVRDLQRTMSSDSPFSQVDALTKKLLDMVSMGRLMRRSEIAKNGRAVEYFYTP